MSLSDHPSSDQLQDQAVPLLFEHDAGIETAEHLLRVSGAGRWNERGHKDSCAARARAF
jgi:hypothetical protein